MMLSKRTLCRMKIICDLQFDLGNRTHNDMDVDMDRTFLIGLRDVKPLADKEHLDEHKALVKIAMLSKLSKFIKYSLQPSYTLFLFRLLEARMKGWTQNAFNDFRNNFKV